MARKQACGPAGDRTDDDGERTGAAVATCDDGGVMQAVGDEPNDSPAAAAWRGRRQGVRGERSIPSPVAMCGHCVGWLMAPNGP